MHVRHGRNITTTTGHNAARRQFIAPKLQSLLWSLYYNQYIVKSYSVIKIESSYTISIYLSLIHI